MMTLPTKREMELYDIWTPYKKRAIYNGLDFKGYELEDAAPRNVREAYKEWREIAENKPRYPSLN